VIRRKKRRLIIILFCVILIAGLLGKGLFDDEISSTNYPTITQIVNNDHLRKSTTEHVNSGAETNHSNELLSNKLNLLELTNRLEIMKSRRPQSEYNPRDVAEAVSRDTAWEIDSGLANYIDLPESDIYDGREFITYDHLKVETLVSGDKLTLYIPHENENYISEIIDVTLHGEDVISWHGILEQYPDGGKVSITQDNKTAYISIFTPHGHYTIESRNGIGWIANSGSLFKDEAPFIPVIDGIPSDPIYPNTNYDSKIP
jgi:hypothetical protein